MNDGHPAPGLIIRRFLPTDGPAVAELFVRVNRRLAPHDMRSAFERYIERSMSEEVGRIEAYYSERGGAFHVAMQNDVLVGMYGLDFCQYPASQSRLWLQILDQCARTDPVAMGRRVAAKRVAPHSHIMT